MIPNDPLFYYQWYLLNGGQAGGIPGRDINVVPAWDVVNGAGIRIIVNDTGADFTNPDLSPNFDFATSQSLDPPYNNPYPFSGDAHGTETAGLIAAASNGYGITGVAFRARVSSYRILGTRTDSIDPWGATEAALLNTANFDVANNSWGYRAAFADSVFDPNDERALEAMLTAATVGRGGLGTINVFASGNGFQSRDDTNLHAFQSSINVVAVAALDANGTVNAPNGRYSTPGASVLVSAPGTGILSDTIVGRGNFADRNLNFGLDGTSFAAPLVTGVVALMLQANPRLGIRDVQQILAYTARKTDPGSPGWHVNAAVNWNGGGLQVSNDYGFGLVDARAAVALAQSWTTQHTIGNRIINTVPVRATGAIAATGTTFTFDVAPGASLALNWVRVQLSFSFSAFNDMRIVLTSPSGTSSVLLSQPDGGRGRSFLSDTAQLSSNQFWGETAAGTWRVTISDANPAFRDTGVLTAATLVLVGDPVAADNTYVYTDQYAAEVAANPSRSFLSHSGGIGDTINLAATSGYNSLDVRPGHSGTIGGAPIAIGGSTFIRSVIAGAGGGMVIGNDIGNVLLGGPARDVLVGGSASDWLSGGVGDDLLSGGVGNMVPALAGAAILSGRMGPEWRAFAAADLAGGGKGGIAWRNTAGQVFVWTLDGSAITGLGLTEGQMGPEWQTAATGDLNNDGRADIVWQANGGIAVWLMAGTHLAAAGAPAGRMGPEWRVAATGDVNGDGRADIIWQSTGNQVAVWLMNGTAIGGVAVTGGRMGPEWRLLGVDDVNGDGRADLLWANRTGQIGTWTMNGATVTGAATVDGRNGGEWTAVSVADLNRDSLADVLWQSGDGAMQMWFLHDAHVTGVSALSGRQGTDWRVTGMRDLTGAGTPAIVTANNAGQAAVWTLDDRDDTLIGGPGRDTFAFGTLAHVGKEIIDFQAGPGGDVLSLHDLLGNIGYAGANPLADGEVRLVQSGPHSHVQVDSHPGTRDYVTIALLDQIAATSLTASNWQF